MKTPGIKDPAVLSREEKLALIRRMATQRSDPSGAPTSGAPTSGAPLSFAQERMWFLDQLEPGNPYNNICRPFEIRGLLNPQILERSLIEVIGRHGTLRTCFPMENGRAVARVSQAATLEMTHIDLTGLSAEDCETRRREEIRRETRHAFELGKGPLFRVRLLHCGPELHVLVVNVHHIVFDGWSLGILLAEMSRFYASLERGEKLNITPLALQYGEYARYQRQHLAGQRLTDLLAWWRRELDGAARTLDLPVDRPRPKLESFRGAGETLALGQELSAAVTQLGRVSKTTLFMTLLTGLGILVSRSAPQKDFLIGTPVAGRGRAELEPLIGLFVGTLVLRVDLSGRPGFKEVLGRIRRRSLDAYSHQELPFERLVEELESERDLSRNPLFQVMFALHNQPATGPAMPGLELRPLPLKRAVSKMDLTLDATETAAGIALYLEFSSDLFDPSTVARLIRQLRCLLTAAVDRPEGSIAELPLLGAAESHHLLVEFNHSRQTDTAGPCLHDLFSARARQTPQAAALSMGVEISYRQLDQQTDRLADSLRRLGVGPDVAVGVFLPRGLDAVIALLGILKAGGAYVPLDPELPARRLEHFIADSRMPVVLTDEGLRPRLPRGPVAQTMDTVFGKDLLGKDLLGKDLLGEDLLADSGQEGMGPTKDHAARVRPDNAAYMIYTSGSTGRPKGVLVPHRAVVRHAAAIAQRYRLKPSDRVLQFASSSFDVAFEELFPTWLAGATVVLRPADLSLVLEDFVGFLERERLSVINLPTPYWHEWAAALPDTPAPPPDLRLVVVGTERALPERLDGWRRETQVTWINSYGCTETTITSTVYQPSLAGARQVAEPADGIRVSVGRPIAGTSTYVVQDLRPAATGVTGELAIGGDGLARGYLRRPRQSAAAFLPDPFSGQPGARLYASGDRARLRATGDLEFLGRADDQVKIRGYRVELGEVETALARDPGVRQVAVLAHREAGAGWRLSAYVVPEPMAQDPAFPEPQTSPSAESLRAGLLNEIPAYMVPGSFVITSDLPQTTSGKLDRKALEARSAAGTEVEAGAARAGFVAPRGPLEELIADTWSDILARPTIGVHDNFFLLGGHSLLATRIASRLRRTLGKEIPLRLLFEAPTVASLAEHLANPAEGPATRPEIAPGSTAGSPNAWSQPLRPRLPGDDTDLPLTFAQRRLWFLDQLEPGNTAYNLASPIRFTGALEADPLERALIALGQRHESLRTTFGEVAGQPVQQIASRPTYSMARIDLSSVGPEDLGERVEDLARKLSGQPFDLTQGPLLRATLLNCPPGGEHILLLVLHHTIADGWSMDILLGELMELYRAGREKRQPQLPRLEVQYADYARWQQLALGGGVLESQLASWRQWLGDAPAALELTTDRPRPAVPSYRGARHYFSLPAAVADGIEALGRRHGATLFMTLLAAYVVLLRRHSAQTDIVVGTPIAGRGRSEIEGLIGLFVNTLVLRADVSGRPTFRALLGRVREIALSAYGCQDVPFEHLVEALKPRRDLSRNPIFQVFFTLLSSARAASLPERSSSERSSSNISSAEISAQTLPLDTGTSQFDLTLTTWREASHREDSHREDNHREDSQLEASLTYSTDLFDATTVARFATHLGRLLAALTDSDTTLNTVESLPLSSNAEVHQILRENNDTTVQAFFDRPAAHLLFSQQAARRPGQTALTTTDGSLSRSLSYGELDRRAHQLAGYLRSLGVGPGALVAILVERSADMLTALLGVWYAGAAYVPVDPEYPRSRITLMIEDSRAGVVLTQEAWLERLPAEQAAFKTVCLDRDRPLFEETPLPHDHPRLAPDIPHAEQLAYVLYTSGSTGRPKGVAIPHRALNNFLASMRAKPGLVAEDRLLAVTTLSFDIAGLELFLPLITGARIELASRDQARDPEHLGQRMEDAEVSFMQATPATWQAMLESDWSGRPGLKILCGGEALTPGLASRLRPACGELWNVYGPTETTIWSTLAQVTDPAPPISIGRPLANTEVFLLGPESVPAPLGIPGELFLGGRGLARGYLGRGGLTAERFVPHPLATERGQRLYRTGDLVRALADGSLEFLGRLDHQVKVRGFRIELGEIEAALERHPEVTSAVAVVQESERIVAYLTTSRDDREIEAAGLHDFLRDHLPSYMLPSFFVTLPELPLTPNGKVDRKQLRGLPLQAPEPRTGGTGGEQPVAPRTDLERGIAAVWEEILGLPEISIHDNFFVLGGHSLLATQVMSRLRREHDMDLPLRTLFDRPTVAGLAEAAVEQSFTDADQEQLTQLLTQFEGIDHEPK